MNSSVGSVVEQVTEVDDLLETALPTVTGRPGIDATRRCGDRVW